jgi:hypothetical protein
MSNNRRRIDPGIFRWAASCGLGLAAATAALLLLSANAAGAPPSKPAILSGHEVVFADSGDPSQALLQSARAECPPGTGIVAGGYGFSNSGIDAFVLISNHPSGEFTVQEPGGQPQFINDGWLVTAKRSDGKAENWGVLAYAVCVDTD